MKLNIDAIEIQDRYRRDFGDIEDLAKSIDELGLLHPAIVDSNLRLIDGERRIRAHQLLGRDTIDVRIIDVPSLLRAEHDANAFAKAWTVSERVAIAKAIEDEVRERAERRMLAGVRNEGDPVGNCPQGEQGKSRDEIAERSGFTSATTYERARKAVTQGTPELVEAMDRGEVAVSTAAIVAELPKEEQKEIVAKGEKEILKAANEIRAAKAKEIRAKRIEKIAEIARGNVELKTDKKYAVLYADPPWKYDVVISTSREIENHYPTMTDDEIAALPVGDLANEDAIIYLWVVVGKVPFGCELLKHWGFEYKSCFVWVKDRMGLGFHSRVQHELLLVGTRGKIPAPAPELRVSSVIEARVQEHSKKPQIVRDWIGEWYSGLPMIELFARQSGEGWDTWGNQSGQCA